MNKKLMGLSALALAISMGQAPLAFADHMKGFCSERMEKIVKKLDLSAEQKTKIDAIKDAAKQKIKPIREEARPLHMQIDDAFKAGKMDEAKIDGFVNQEKDIMGRILKIRMMERYDIYTILTAEQKEKAAAMIQKWKEKHEKEAKEDDQKID